MRTAAAIQLKNFVMHYWKFRVPVSADPNLISVSQKVRDFMQEKVLEAAHS